MKKTIFLIAALMFVRTISNSQETAMQLSGNDCNGVPHDLFADLDAGKVVVLFFFMPNCTSCPPPAKKIQTMANNVMKTHPGMIKGYAMPFQNSTTCEYTASWVSSNVLSLYAPFSKGATQVAYYGGFGMPTVVLLGGKDHKVLFSTLSFKTSDTTIMKNKILEVLNTSSVNELPSAVSAFEVFPNPANDNISVTIDLKQPTRVSIDITDLTGQQVFVIMEEEQTGLINRQFSLSSLTDGNYIIRLRVNSESYTQKLSIVH